MKQTTVKSKKMPIEEYVAKLDGINELEEGEQEEGGEGKVKRIVRLYIAGYTPKEIISIGFNASTVYCQTGAFKKLKKAPALTYGTTGFGIYEMRVQRMMREKKISREEAVKIIQDRDTEVKVEDVK